MHRVNAQLLLEGCLSIGSRGYMTVRRRHTHPMQGFKRMNPFCIPFAITNMPGAILAMDLGFMGPNYSISTACATGNYCILRWEGDTRLTTALSRLSYVSRIGSLCLPYKQWACSACCIQAQRPHMCGTAICVPAAWAMSPSNLTARQNAELCFHFSCCVHGIEATECPAALQSMSREGTPI